MADGLEGLLSPRSVEDVFAERVRVRLAGQEYTLPVLTIEREEAWKRDLDGKFDEALRLVGEKPEVSLMVSVMEQYPDKLLDALVAYDETGVLPSRDDIRRTATQIQLLRAVLEVRQSLNPLAVIGLAIGLEMMASANRERSASGARSNSRPRRTGGRRAKSAGS